ncbi:MAG: DNA-processing protein DprA [Ruminococcaceae bacterium]|nr:DNA-processing protein DprA [Oscillospiraceae bacterium]
MTGREKGFLLLTSKLGNPERKCLTVPQFRDLARRAEHLMVDDPNRDMRAEDLLHLGYNVVMAERIIGLLQEEDLCRHYISKGARGGCTVLTRISEEYPRTLQRKLQLEAPGSLWTKGDLAVLDTPALSLVGSRELSEENREFAREVGRQAAIQGYTLISGNARGADREAQESCLQHGGKVISVVADRLQDQEERENVLYLSEDGYDLPFSAQRALSRNRVIHALPTLGVFVAQCNLQFGGTWNGTEKNLKYGWSSVFCYGDQSPAQIELCLRGAEAVTTADLSDFYALQTKDTGLF